MKIMLKSRKGVSPVIASLLLIAISVAAAVITYSWVMAMIDSQGSAAQTAIRMEDVQFYGNYDSNGVPVPGQYAIRITIRNTGSVPVTITTVYIYQSDTRIMKADELTLAIKAGNVDELGFITTDDPDLTWTDAPLNKVEIDNLSFDPSSAYRIKVVSNNGFLIEGTYYSPSTLQVLNVT